MIRDFVEKIGGGYAGGGGDDPQSAAIALEVLAELIVIKDGGGLTMEQKTAAALSTINMHQDNVLPPLGELLKRYKAERIGRTLSDAETESLMAVDPLLDMFPLDDYDHAKATKPKPTAVPTAPVLTTLLTGSEPTFSSLVTAYATPVTATPITTTTTTTITGDTSNIAAVAAKFCTQCGTKLAGGANFCSNCGERCS